MGTLHTIVRRTFYATAAVSSLLLLATLILWPLSHHRAMVAMFVDPKSGNYGLNVACGRVGYAYDSWASAGGLRLWTAEIGPGLTDPWSYLSWNNKGPMIDGVPYGSTTLGVKWYWDTTPHIPVRFRRPLTIVFLYLPFSYLTLLFSILPLLAFRSLRRRRKAARTGLCPKCHYDLRAHHSGAAGPLCPECGTPVTRLASSPQRGDGL